MVFLVFRIHSASLIHIICRSSFLSITLTPSQSITVNIVSLFTNILVDLALQIIRDRLVADKDLKHRTLLNVDDIMDLLKFVVTTTCFSFRGVIYQQKFGTAMGSPVSPILANLFMEWLEQQAIATAPVDCKPRLWKRYVDDILEVMKRGKVGQLTDHINTIDPTGNINLHTRRKRTERSLFWKHC